MSPLESRLRWLLNWLCTEWGFCIPPADVGRISQNAVLSAEEFATAVLAAEGMDPEYELEWMRKIKHRFVEEFGSTVSAEAYLNRGERGIS